MVAGVLVSVRTSKAMPKFRNKGRRLHLTSSSMWDKVRWVLPSTVSTVMAAEGGSCELKVARAATMSGLAVASSTEKLGSMSGAEVKEEAQEAKKAAGAW